MNLIRKGIFFYAICCAWLLSVPQVSHAQLSEMESLKALVRDIGERLQEALKRIEQLEQEKAEQALAPAQPAQPAIQSTLGALNPAITVFGNFVGRADSKRVFNEDGDRISNKFNLREVEIDMRAAIDPYADGVLIASFESETPGRFSASVEEGYALPRSASLGVKIKGGPFPAAFREV